MDFLGSMVALVTPFRNEVVDEPALQALVRRMVEGGVHALVPCGTTGESPTLSHDEHDRVVEIVVQAAAGQVPVVAGTGSNSTAEAVRLSKAAARAGASGLLVVTPYYNRPTQQGLQRHFETVADATDLPVMLYDIPSRTGVRIELDTLERLARHPNLRGLKLATGEVESVTRIRAATDLAVLSGDDGLTLPMMALGARGVVSVAANLLPSEVRRLVDAAAAGDFASARQVHDRLHPLFRALFLETNPVPVKAAMAELGWISPEIRLPLTPMTEANRCRLLAALAPFRDALG